MSFATILVHVEADSVRDTRLALAIDLANQFDAKLIGIGAKRFRTGYYGNDMAAEDFIVDEIESLEADLKRAEEKFRIAATAVHKGSDWRGAAEFPLVEIAAEARAADLVVTSRCSGGASAYNAAAPGALVLQTGRPVLVVPPEATKLNAGSVIVAWKEAREARRAVADAVPFLQRAGTLHLVEICGSKDLVSAATTRLADVASHLQRHGVTATVSVQVEEKGATATDLLLDIAERQKADLIVAGAYGHSRFQEWVFGGFTRALLAQTAIAVLFSH